MPRQVEANAPFYATKTVVNRDGDRRLEMRFRGAVSGASRKACQLAEDPRLPKWTRFEIEELREHQDRAAGIVSPGQKCVREKHVATQFRRQVHAFAEGRDGSIERVSAPCEHTGHVPMREERVVPELSGRGESAGEP